MARAEAAESKVETLTGAARKQNPHIDDAVLKTKMWRAASLREEMAHSQKMAKQIVELSDQLSDQQSHAGPLTRSSSISDV